MKYRMILLIASLSLFSFINVKAICSSTDLNELKKIAEKIEFTYDYTFEKKGNNEVVDFKITAVNLNEQIKALIIKDYYMDDYREFKYNSSKQNSLNGFSGGEQVKVTFKAYTANECAGKTVFAKTITLPYYNQFYNSEECKQNPNFKYCESQLLNYSVTKTQFDNELVKFLNQIDNNDNNTNDDNKNNNSKIQLDSIIGLGIIVIIVLVLISLIFIKIKQIRKKRSL